MTLDEFISALDVDLTNCDREPIHIPGRIQPHGALLVLRPDDQVVLQASTNTRELLGVEVEALLGHPLTDVLDLPALQELRQFLITDKNRYTRPLMVELTVNGTPRRFDGLVHSIDGLLVLELELSDRVLDDRFSSFYAQVRFAMQALETATTLEEMSQVIAQQVRQVTGFDRVMIYQFDEQGHGTVVAEEKREDLSAFLGLHYPASDIPKQARLMYLLNWLRLIPDIGYTPVTLEPVHNPQTGRPLDMTYAVLRSVSPIHIEYLQNMGVGASMSISIIHEGRLWGLVACHHYSPHHIPYTLRSVSEFLAQLFSLQLAALADRTFSEERIRVKGLLAKSIEVISLHENTLDGLHDAMPLLIDLVDAQGLALWLENNQFTTGNTPDNSDIDALIAWLNTENVPDVFATSQLSTLFPPAAAYQAIASGLLALRLSKSQPEYLLWFREEVVQTVTWAGNPDKAMTVTEDEARLSPRKSFEAWKQTVDGTSLPWLPYQFEAAAELHRTLISIVMKKVDALIKLNAELESSNNELDAFAYIASHDLKEPLRGIHNFANFLLEDYGGVIEEDGVQKLQTLVRLTQRMEDLINSLLHYSRVGRVELAFDEVNLDETVKRTLEMLMFSFEQSGQQIEVVYPRPLPTMRADRVRVGEIFHNLISNAVKYNTQPVKRVEIGYREPEDPGQPMVFMIADNGIGIPEKHHEAIFRIFKRLHPREAYGGGTGAGLTIVRKIVERHGGRMWIDSQLGEGSTFFFTLQRD